MAAPFIRVPFATSGDKTTVPVASQVDGSVSYTDGYGIDYGLPIDSDPDALPIERTKFNQLMNDLTSAIQQYRIFSTPDFITTAATGGTPFSYSKYVRVRYDPGTGPLVYESFIDSNTDLPTVTTSWRQVVTTSSPIIWGGAATGTANALIITPSVPLASYGAGIIVNTIPSITNTSGTVTANVSGKGTRNILKSIGSALVVLAIGDLQIGVPAMLFDDGTEYVLMNPRTYSHAASISTSSTLNLDAATGDYVSLTGTTGVTGVTLQEGREVTCVAGGAFTMTNSASLILKGAANISVAVGDSFVLRGEAAGVVRMVNYSRQNGTALVQGTSASPIEGSSTNMLIQKASNTTISIAYDEVVVKTALGGTSYLGVSGSFTNNCATTGAGGLDTGSLVASTFYSVYSIYNPTSNTFQTLTCLASASTAEIYAGTHMPSGYTASALIGMFQTDTFTNIKSFYSTNRRVWFPTLNALNVTASAPTTYTSLSLVNFIPPNAKTFSGTIGSPQAGGSPSIVIAADSSGTGEKIHNVYPSATAANTLDSFGASTPFSDLPVIQSQTCFYKARASTDQIRMDITEYTF